MVAQKLTQKKGKQVGVAGGSSRASSVKHSAFRLVKTKRDTILAYTKFYDTLKPAEKTALQYYKYAGYVPINQHLRTNDTDIFTPRCFISAMHPNIPVKMREEYKEEYKTLGPTTTLRELSGFVYKYFIRPPMDAIRAMDAVFANPAIPKIPKQMGSDGKPVTLYRGVTIPGIRKHKVGDVIEMHDYLSTSFSPRVSVGFMELHGEQPDTVLFVLRGLQGQPYVFLDWKGVEQGKLTGLHAWDGGDEYEYVLPRGMKFRVVKSGFTSEFSKYIGDSIVTIGLDRKLGSDASIDAMNNAFLDRESVRQLGKLYVMELEFIERKPREVKLFGPKLNYEVTLGLDLSKILNPPKSKPKVDKPVNEPASIKPNK
jgi:hypothetical protein